jgi:peptidoglycan/LPS O-acetylase OafA/YrhL
MGAYAYYFVRRPDPWQAAKAYLLDRGGLVNNTTLTHLWFLYYLLIFSVAAWALAPTLDRLASPLRRILAHPALLALPTLLALLAMEVGALDTPQSFLPTPRILAAYGWFYLVGWGLFRNREVLASLPARSPLHLAAAVLLTAANVWFLILQLPHRPNWDPNLRIAAAVTGALAVWYWNHGLTGWFLRHAARPHPWSRYLADSAYWQYLAHPVVLVPLQVAVQPLMLPTATKLFLVLAFSIPLLLLSYHWLVRATALGALLNGRRYPRQWPLETTAFASPCSGCAADPDSAPSPLPGAPQTVAPE